jgi:quercetin dioxygenase-like cupin family protein
MKRMKRKHVHRDLRGDIYDLITNELISSVGLVTFTPGSVRGNHIHYETAQWNYVIRGTLFVITDLNGVREESHFETGDLFLIPPGEAHAMKATGDSEMMVFTLGPRAGENFEEDTLRLGVPLIEPN